MHLLLSIPVPVTVIPSSVSSVSPRQLSPFSIPNKEFHPLYLNMLIHLANRILVSPHWSSSTILRLSISAIGFDFEFLQANTNPHARSVEVHYCRMMVRCGHMVHSLEIMLRL